MVATNYIVCYDIVENKVRSSISSLCQDFGLERIQFSVFYGQLYPNQLREIKLQIKEIINNSDSNVHVIRVCAACEREHNVLFSFSLEKFENNDNNNKEKQYSELSTEIKSDEGIIIL